SSSHRTHLCRSSLYRHPPPRPLHAFPTRRSSDLSVERRSSISSPSGLRVLMRPSCGRRFSTTSMRPRILMREVIATITENGTWRSEEHTSELQSRSDLVCRLLLEKKNKHHEHTQK